MKTSDLILLGGAAIAGYYLFTKSEETFKNINQSVSTIGNTFNQGVLTVEKNLGIIEPAWDIVQSPQTSVATQIENVINTISSTVLPSPEIPTQQTSLKDALQNTVKNIFEPTLVQGPVLGGVQKASHYIWSGLSLDQAQTVITNITGRQSSNFRLMQHYQDSDRDWNKNLGVGTNDIKVYAKYTGSSWTVSQVLY